MKKNLFFSLSCLCVLGLFEASIIEVSASKKDKMQANRDRRAQREMQLKSTQQTDQEKKDIKAGSTSQQLSFANIADQMIIIGDEPITLRQILNKETKGLEFDTKEQKNQAKRNITNMIAETYDNGRHKHNDECNNNLNACVRIIDAIEIKKKNENGEGEQRQDDIPQPQQLKAFDEVKGALFITVGGINMTYEAILNAQQELVFKDEAERTAALDKIGKEIEKNAIYKKDCIANFKKIEQKVKDGIIKQEEQREEGGYVDELVKEDIEKIKGRVVRLSRCTLNGDSEQVRADFALFLKRIIAPYEKEEINAKQGYKIIAAVIAAICNDASKAIISIEDNEEIAISDFINAILINDGKLFGKDCREKIPADNATIDNLSRNDNILDKMIEKYGAEGEPSENYAKAAEESIVSAFEGEGASLKFADWINLNDDIGKIINKIREHK